MLKLILIFYFTYFPNFYFINLKFQFKISVNAKKWVNGQSVPRMQLYDYVSYSLHVSKVIRSQVSPKNSHNELSAKKKAVREIGELSPD